jgi:hypothetical protein
MTMTYSMLLKTKLKQSMSKLTVTPIPNLNLLVIKQFEGRDFFISAPNSIIISVTSLAFLIKFLVQNGFISEQVLVGILEEQNTGGGEET